MIIRPATEREKALARLAIYEGDAENVRAFRAILDEAMWDGDMERLDELAHCRCCCHEHTFEGCEARLWYGCRGQGSMTRSDEQAWERHYATHHGMSADTFYGYADTFTTGDT